MWMQSLLWLVMGLFSVDILVGLILALVRKSFDFNKLPSFLHSDILTNIFPLILLAQFTHKDPTHLVLPVLFFVAALGLAIKYARAIVNKFKS